AGPLLSLRRSVATTTMAAMARASTMMNLPLWNVERGFTPEDAAAPFSGVAFCASPPDAGFRDAPQLSHASAPAGFRCPQVEHICPSPAPAAGFADAADSLVSTSGEPHFPQNLSPGETRDPHFGHTTSGMRYAASKSVMMPVASS